MVPLLFVLFSWGRVPTRCYHYRGTNRTCVGDPTKLPQRYCDESTVGNFQRDNYSLGFPLQVEGEFHRPIFERRSFPSFCLFCVPTISTSAIGGATRRYRDNFLFSFLVGRRHFVSVFLGGCFRYVKGSFVIGRNVGEEGYFPMSFRFFFHRWGALREVRFHRPGNVSWVPKGHHRFYLHLFFVRKGGANRHRATKRVHFTRGYRGSTGLFYVRPANDHPCFPWGFFFPSIRGGRLFGQQGPTYLPVHLCTHRSFIHVANEVRPNSHFRSKGDIFPTVVRVVGHGRRTR